MDAGTIRAARIPFRTPAVAATDGRLEPKLAGGIGLRDARYGIAPAGAATGPLRS
jgi:hypothetical protein